MKELKKELDKFTNSLFCWEEIKKILLKYGSDIKINTGYGIGKIQVFLDEKEIIFELIDDFIVQIYL